MGESGGWFYIDDYDHPDLQLSEAVEDVLLHDGGFAYLSEQAGLRFKMDYSEADELPVACLERLAAACILLAERYSTPPAVRQVAHEAHRLRGDMWEARPYILEAPAEEIRSALLALAEVCDRARGQGKTVWVQL